MTIFLFWDDLPSVLSLLVGVFFLSLLSFLFNLLIGWGAYGRAPKGPYQSSPLKGPCTRKRKPLRDLQLPLLATCFRSAPRSSVVGGLYPIRLCPSCPRRCSRPRCRASGPRRCSGLIRFSLSLHRLLRCVPIRCINSKLDWHCILARLY